MSDRYAEETLTKACRAGAVAIYEQNVVRSRYPVTGDLMEVPPFDELPREVQNALVDAAIPIVWAALNAVPDGRWTVWQQGYDAGFRNGADLDLVERENPYPPPEWDTSAL